MVDRIPGGGIALALLVALAPLAHAEADTKQTFEATADGAVRIDREALAGLLWSLTAKCTDGDELAQRQCRAVRAARLRKVSGRRFVVPGDAGAFAAGAFDAKKLSLALTLSGCVACVEPIPVGGRAMYVVSKKEAPTFQGAVARAAVLHETTRSFQNEGAASEWRSTVLPRLRTELVVEIAGEKALWKRGEKEGIAVDVVGFRVYDPCDGTIVVASPKSQKAAIDRAACGEAATDEPKDAPKKVVENIPDELTATQIKQKMAGVRGAADACFQKYGVAGDAKLHVTVAADGSVVAVDQTGDFKGTPTGDCIEEAVKAVQFPKTKKSRQSFKYPIVLR